ncbi:MAG TPA: PD-(D/E)XK nuclease family protein, partial [Acidimicrobiales bacterium]
DPLAPVTVVVPSAPASVSVRRALGRHADTGLANVRTLALPQLAELLASPLASAGGRRPLSPTWNAATVRAGLADARPPLSRVPGSAAVEEALTLTFARLREASEGELRALEKRSARAAAVIDRFVDHRSRLAGHLDRHDVLILAATAVRDGRTAVDELGPVILHLPRRLGRSDLALMEALAARTEVVAVLGVTGDSDGDRPLRRLLHQLEPVLGPAPALPEVPDPVPARIVLAPDPDEEAREAVRTVLARLEADPVDLDRIAIVSRVASPYRLLLHEHLETAGLPHHADLPWSVAQSTPGRVLLGLLDLPEHGYRRADVARWLRSGPIQWQGRPVPASRWDAVARRSGVVQGLDQWHDRLDQRRSELAAAVEAGWSDAEYAESRTRQVDELQAFVAEIGDLLGAGRRSWSAWSAWSQDVLDRYLVGGGTVDWAEDDLADLRDVRARVVALAELDAVDGPSEAGRFRRVLADELARTPRRVGRLGRGVQVGDLESVYGLDLDLVVVVGMAVGWYPPRHRDDPLLPDHELVDAGLADALGRPDRSDERRDHLAARAAGAEVVLLAPRSDPRGQRELQPARWLMEELGDRTGWPVGVSDVADLEVGWLERPRSFEESVRRVTVPLDAGERDLAAVLASTVAGSPELHDHPVVAADPRLARGLQAVAARRDRAYGEWTGHIGVRDELRVDDEALASATRLERFALCPFQYLLGNVLGVRAHEDPVDEEGITPRDRGSLVHQVLEEFFAEALDRDPDAGWTDADLERLHAIVDHVGEAYRARGMTGRDLGWELESSAIRRWLGAVLDRDADERSARQARPAAVELLFGGDSEYPAAEVGLPDGRRLRFKGAIDRVDREADGSLLVIDYKTGRGGSYRNVDDDRLDRGKRLQLPIYADAARRALGPADGPPPPVEAYYWFVEEGGKKAWRGGPVDEAVQDRFEDVVATVVDGIEGGDFPANPGEDGFYGPSHCGYCDFNRVCPSSRVDLWEGVRKDEAIARYVELAEGELP